MEESLAKPIELLSKQIAFLGEKIKGTQSIVPSEGGSTFKDKEPLTPNLTPTEVNREKQKAVVFGKALGIGVYTPKGKLEDLTPDTIKAVTASATVAKQQEAGMGILKLIGGILGVGANLLALTSAYKFLREWIPKIFGPGAKGIFDSIDEFLKPVTDFIDEMKQKFLEWFKEEFPETYKFFEDTINSIKGFFKELKNTWMWFLEGDDSPLRDMPKLEKAIFGTIDFFRNFFEKINNTVVYLREGGDGFKGFAQMFKEIKDFFTNTDGIVRDLKIVTENLVMMVTRPKDYAYNLTAYGKGMPTQEEIDAAKRVTSTPAISRIAKPIGRLLGSNIDGVYDPAYDPFSDEITEREKRKIMKNEREWRDYTMMWSKRFNLLKGFLSNTGSEVYQDAVFKNGQAYGISNDDDILALKSGGPLDRIFKKQDNMMVSYSRSLLQATMKQIELLARIETNTAAANQLLSNQKPTIVQTGSRDSSKQRIFNRKEYEVDSSPLFDYKLLA